MPATPTFRGVLVAMFIDGASDWQIHATTDPYDPGLPDENDWALVGDPIDVSGIALDSRPDGQIWIVYDGSPLTLSDVPANTDVAGLILTVAHSTMPFRLVVAYLDRRADTTPIAFTADGRDYEMTFPGGFLVRVL